MPVFSEEIEPDLDDIEPIRLSDIQIWDWDHYTYFFCGNIANI